MRSGVTQSGDGRASVRWATVLGLAMAATGACTLGAAGTKAEGGAPTTNATTGQGGAATTTGGGGATTSTGHGGAGSGGAGTGGLGGGGAGLGGTGAGGTGAGGTGTGGTGTGGHAGAGGLGGAGTGGSGGLGGAGGQGTGGGPDGGAIDGGDAGPEDCLNGVDDDGDGKIDCADLDCTPDFECVPQAPVGWTGYFRVAADTYPVGNRPPCADSSQPDAFFAEPRPATCESCACGPLTGAACGAPDVTCWAGVKNCSGPDSTAYGAKLSNGTCQDVTISFPANDTDSSCKVTTAMKPGSCPPSGGAYEASPPVGKEVDRCGEATKGGAGCKAGSVCIPKGAGPYAAAACMQKADHVPCPNGWTAYHVGSSFSDDRGCTPCDCKPDTKCSNAKVVVSDNAGCKGSTQDLVDTACHDTTAKFANGVGALQLTAPSALSATGCAPTGGAPAGSVELTGKLTICCK
jgi:hypothetical protein